MWRIFIGFVFHRAILYGASLLVISYSINSQEKSSLVPPLQSPQGLNSRLLAKVAELPEHQWVSQWASRPTMFSDLVKSPPPPFIALGAVVSRFTSLPLSATLMLLSSAFFLLLLMEIFQLLSRIASEEIATVAGVLLVFWPTSYELSLGSSLAAEAYFITWAVRTAIDDKWVFCGIALLLAGLTNATMLGILPLVICWFWFYTRNYQWMPVVRRTLYIAIPVGIAVLLNSKDFSSLPSLIHQSAFFSLLSGSHSADLKWTLSQSMAGQTIAVVILMIGAGVAAASNFSLLHRAIPIYFLLFWLLFSPYGTLASRVPIAGVCFQGIANVSSSPLTKLILAIFLAAGVYEIYLVFS